MRYLYIVSGYKLYETEEEDSDKPGVLGNKYSTGTILLFEEIEKKCSIGSEVAWTETEEDAEKLAEQLHRGERNILIAVRADQAEKAVEITAKNNKMKKGRKKKTDKSFLICKISESEKMAKEWEDADD